MKKLVIAALAAAGLGGCVAVPAPYYGDAGYYPAPALSFGVHAQPAYYGHRHRGHRHHHRHHRHH